MGVVVLIPEVLRRYSGGMGEVPAEGETVAEALEDVFARHSGLRARVLDERGAVYPYLRLYRGGEDVELGSELAEGDEIEIIAAVAGG
jgi:molybdopterin converting factor small subunit